LTIFLKILLQGEGGVGKSTLLNRFLGQPIAKHYMATIGLRTMSYLTQYNNKQIKLSIIDFAGQERFKKLLHSLNNLHRGADATLLCFDLADLNTLEPLPEWYEAVARIEPNVPAIIVGTKADKISSQSILEEIREKAKILAKTLEEEYKARIGGIIFTSAFQNICVKEPFKLAVELGYQYMLEKHKERFLWAQLNP